jgi:SAM-dependent methyltransferase
MSILDIGSGRAPSLPVADRPRDCSYVGLDISHEELEAAGQDAYSESVVADIAQLVPALSDRFDLAISWQVFEHVEHTDEAMANVKRYLHDGGTLISLLSGSYAAFSVANRVIPDRVGHALVTKTMGRQPEKDPVFQAHYDRCSASGLREVMSDWTSVEIRPFYRAATYFEFFTPLKRAYLAYENFIARRNVENLATHYLIVASK